MGRGLVIGVLSQREIAKINTGWAGDQTGDFRYHSGLN